jgi:hypothetical protein
MRNYKNSGMSALARASFFTSNGSASFFLSGFCIYPLKAAENLSPPKMSFIPCLITTDFVSETKNYFMPRRGKFVRSFL